MSLDFESIIYKTYQHFFIYTVRTEQLKDYTVFVEIEFKKLLSHSVTRWLSLYPSLSRMIHMYPAIQSHQKNYSYSKDVYFSSLVLKNDSRKRKTLLQ